MALLALFLFAFSSVACISPLDGQPPLDDLVVPEGYPFEMHVVSTEDGYNLALYRMPHGLSNGDIASSKGPRPVVYLQHGLLDTSAAFLMNGPSGSLAFILADSGYDVWMGNSRGNTYSDISLQQQNMGHDEFWDFSLNELIKYDLPALLQYVLDHTGVPTLVYVGDSQGTALAHALFSTQHPISERVSIAFMLSPVAFVRHITSHFLRALAMFGTEDLVAALGYHQFLPSQKNIHKFLGPFCRDTFTTCADVAALLYGYNPDNIDNTKWDTYFKYVPAGTSVKVMAHWAQGVRNRDDKVFEAFDYGTQCWSWKHFKSKPCNQYIYKSRYPPRYDLSKIRVPLVYFYGGHDALADMVDVLNLKEALSPGVLVDEHVELEYTHLDFVYGIDAPERVYRKIVRKIREWQETREAAIAIV